MAKEILRVGVVGTGNIAQRIHLPLLSVMKNIKLEYVADVSDPARIAERYQVKGIVIGEDVSVLPDCDIALLATPVGVRGRYIREFSKRGTPIFSEKPFAANTREHDRFVELSRKVSCNYMRTCYSATNQVKSILEAEMFGSLRSIEVGEGGIAGPTGKGSSHYQSKIELSGGGVLMERGCHTLSQLTHILSGPGMKVTNASILNQGQFDVEAQSTIEIAKYGFVELVYTITMVRPIHNLAKFVFDRAEVSYEHNQPGSVVKVRPRSHSDSSSCFEIMPDKGWARTDAQAYFLKWNSFLDKIRSEEKIDAKKETSYDTTRLITDIYSRTKQR